MWKGTLELPGQKQLPFLVFLDLKQPAPSGYFLNGSEQTPIPEVELHGDSLTFVFQSMGLLCEESGNVGSSRENSFASEKTRWSQV